MTTIQTDSARTLLNSIVSGIPDAIFAKDLDGRYMLFNSAAEKFTGKTSAEVLGKNDFDLFPPEVANRLMEKDRKVIADGVVTTFEERVTTASGIDVTFLVTKGTLIDANGKVTGIFGISRDFTERKIMEEALQEAKLAAESTSRAKSEFLANMSHEIRTPMNGVIGLLELLLCTGLTDEQRRYADLARQSGRNLVQLISDILDLSKIEAHRIELETVDFDLQTEINGAVNMLVLHSRAKGLSLDSTIDPDVPLYLKGDPLRLRQIISNLIGNAIKFTEKGSVSLHIRKDAEDEQCATLRFLVRDSGIGVAANKFEAIFEPFTQADGSTSRKFGGTGLGLSIARQFVELMGGTVGVESVEGEGATFWFTAMLEKITKTVPASDASPTLTIPRKPEEEHLASTRKIYLLLTEDDPVNQLVTKKILERSGYRVDVASDGREALKLLEENDYALVLMDCMMPNITGYEATSVIRDQGSSVRNHSIPIIAMTANSFKEDRDKCLAAGMDDYLSKPFVVADMVAVIEKWANK